MNILDKQEQLAQRMRTERASAALRLCHKQMRFSAKRRIPPGGFPKKFCLLSCFKSSSDTVDINYQWFERQDNGMWCFQHNHMSVVMLLPEARIKEIWENHYFFIVSNPGTEISVEDINRAYLYPQAIAQVISHL